MVADIFLSRALINNKIDNYHNENHNTGNFLRDNNMILKLILSILMLFKVRDISESSGNSSKPHCFELYAAGNEVIKACKTDADGKVVEGNKALIRR